MSAPTAGDGGESKCGPCMRDMGVVESAESAMGLCCECPLLAASRGNCPLRATCPVYEQASPLHRPPLTIPSRMLTRARHGSTKGVAGRGGGGAGGEVCEHCHGSLDGLVVRKTLRCPACETLVAPEQSGLDYFDLLQDGRRSFDLDRDLLRRSFLALQRQMHPDRFAHVDDGPGSSRSPEAGRAAAWSATINKAHETLRSDLARAIYLYNLRSPEEPYGEECSGSSMDEEDLIEFLTLREQIEEAQRAEQVQRIANDLDAMTSAVRKSLTRGFARQGEHNDDGALRQSLRRAIDRLKFLETIREAAEARHHQLSHGR